MIISCSMAVASAPGTMHAENLREDRNSCLSSFSEPGASGCSSLCKMTRDAVIHWVSPMRSRVGSSWICILPWSSSLNWQCLSRRNGFNPKVALAVDFSGSRATLPYFDIDLLHALSISVCHFLLIIPTFSLDIPHSRSFSLTVLL